MLNEYAVSGPIRNLDTKIGKLITVDLTISFGRLEIILLSCIVLAFVKLSSLATPWRLVDCRSHILCSNQDVVDSRSIYGVAELPRRFHCSSI